MLHAHTHCEKCATVFSVPPPPLPAAATAAVDTGYNSPSRPQPGAPQLSEESVPAVRVAWSTPVPWRRQGHSADQTLGSALCGQNGLTGILRRQPRDAPRSPCIDRRGGTEAGAGEGRSDRCRLYCAADNVTQRFTYSRPEGPAS